MTDELHGTPPAARHLHGPSVWQRFSAVRRQRMSPSPTPAAEIAQGGVPPSQTSISSNSNGVLERQSEPKRPSEAAPDRVSFSRPSARRRAVALLISAVVVVSIPALLFALFFLV